MPEGIRAINLPSPPVTPGSLWFHAPFSMGNAPQLPGKAVPRPLSTTHIGTTTSQRWRVKLCTSVKVCASALCPRQQWLNLCWHHNQDAGSWCSQQGAGGAASPELAPGTAVSCSPAGRPGTGRKPSGCILCSAVTPFVSVPSPQVHAEQLPGQDTQHLPVCGDAEAELAVSTWPWAAGSGAGAAPRGGWRGLGAPGGDRDGEAATQPPSLQGSGGEQDPGGAWGRVPGVPRAHRAVSTPGTPLGGLGAGGALLGPLFPLLWARQGAVFHVNSFASYLYCCRLHEFDTSSAGT